MIIYILLLILSILVYAYLLYKWHESFEDCGSKENIDLVVARYEENLDWLGQLDLAKFRKIIIYNKGSDLPKLDNCEIVSLPNVGRCDHTYIYHIVSNYDDLGDVTIYLPGSCSMPYKWRNATRTIDLAVRTNKSVFIGTKKDVLREEYNFTLDNWKASNQQNSSVNNENKLFECPERPFGKWYEKNFGNVRVDALVYFGIFAVGKKDTHHRSLDSYKNLITYLDGHSNPEAGHYFERAWLAVFHPVSQDCIYS